MRRTDLDSSRGINKHFRREALIMCGLLVGVVVLGMVVAMIAPWLMRLYG